jgi:hypothetical protein
MSFPIGTGSFLTTRPTPTSGIRTIWIRLTEARKAELFEANQHRLSLDAYLEICADTGAVPLIGINMFQGYRNNRTEDSIAKAVRLVHYCRDRITGPRYYYLDNEAGHQPTRNNHLPIADYLPLIPDYSRAIKAADPQAKIAVNIMRWNQVEAVIRDYGDEVDLYDQHWYYNNLTWGEFRLEEWRQDVLMGDYTQRLNQFKSWVETYDKPHVQIGFLEWNLGPSTGANGSDPGTVFYQGLVQADMLMHMIRFDTSMASIWPLTWSDNFRNLMDGPDHAVSPTVHIHRAFSKAGGGTKLNLSGPEVQGLRHLAVQSADAAFLDFYFLNKSTVPIELRIELPAPALETWLMHYGQGESADQVDVRESYRTGGGNLLPIHLDDTSFTHVRCRIGGEPRSQSRPKLEFSEADTLSLSIPDFRAEQAYKLLRSEVLGQDLGWELVEALYTESGGRIAPVFELSVPENPTFYRVLAEPL